MYTVQGHQFRSLKQIKVHRSIDPMISVLVRVKNEGKAIGAFLRSLKRQSIFDNIEVVFLDSGSTDDTISHLTSFPASVFTIAPEEFSFGPTCNLICSLAHAPLHSLMSGHIELSSPDLLTSGMGALRAAGPLSAAYFRQIPNSVVGASSYERAYLRHAFPPGPALQYKASNQHSFSNAASLFRRDVWQKIPFPSAKASEDYLWAEELLAAGGKILYLPELCVLHSHNEQPHQIAHRVKINVDARVPTLKGWSRTAKYLIGVTGSCLLEGAGPFEAIRFGWAHASAYVPRRSGVSKIGTSRSV